MGKNRAKIAFFLPLLLLCSFTRCDYNDILLGTSIQEVVRCYGDPYSVEACGDRSYEYRYIERFAMNNELVYENHYILNVVNGQVVNKRIKTEYRQPFDQLYQPNPYAPYYP